MFRLILFVILLLFFYTILRYLMKDMTSRRKKINRKSEPEELVQDPYCKTYIPKKSALRKKVSGQNYFFCKKECLEKFIQNEN